MQPHDLAALRYARPYFRSSPTTKRVELVEIRAMLCQPLQDFYVVVLGGGVRRRRSLIVGKIEISTMLSQALQCVQVPVESRQ
eukprot:m.524353 g.524353  ORF g.524353 m.524353 type:complete len:83 (+) comp57528_c0_seq59:1051-1299(+)